MMQADTWECICQTGRFLMQSHLSLLTDVTACNAD